MYTKPGRLQHCFLGEGGGVVVVFSAFKSFILKLDVVTSVFLNIFVKNCRSGKRFRLLIKVNSPPGMTNQKQYTVLRRIISREIKMHVYRKRHMSGSS